MDVCLFFPVIRIRVPFSERAHGFSQSHCLFIVWEASGHGELCSGPFSFCEIHDCNLDESQWSTESLVPKNDMVIWKLMAHSTFSPPAVWGIRGVPFNRNPEAYLMASCDVDMDEAYGRVKKVGCHRRMMKVYLGYGCVDVSKNRGFPPKSSILIRFSIIFTIHFGVPPFLETSICRCWRMDEEDRFPKSIHLPGVYLGGPVGIIIHHFWISQMSKDFKRPLFLSLHSNPVWRRRV